MARIFKLIVHVPLSHADVVRAAIGDAGGGRIGNYSYCSFSSRGIGRFKGNEQSKPYIGQTSQYEQVEEESIEVSPISEDIILDVIREMKKAHPYEETSYQVIELIDL